MTLLLIFITLLAFQFVISNTFGLILRWKGRYYVIDNLKIFQSNFVRKKTAFVLGFDLSKTIYTSRNYKNNFYSNEFKALMLHEYGHIRLYHATIITIIRTMMVSYLIMAINPLNGFKINTIFIVLFTISLAIYILTKRQCEYQADEFVVKMKLGGVLASALGKKKESKYGLLHPTREKRFKNMLKIIKANA